MLEQAARGAGVTMRLLQRVEGVEMGPEGPVLVTGQGERIGPGLVVGGDGLHSVVRSALNGEAPAQFTGQIAWRAVIEAEPGARAEAEVHMGPGRHLVSYPLRGGRLRNIVAVEERSRWVEEGWSLRDDPLEMRLAFAKFSPRVRHWLDQVGDCWLWGLFRHPVAVNWGWTPAGGGAAGLALLGDGAHPTLPFLAQGANMALEDAWVLAACLDTEDDTGRALVTYQSARRARCQRIVDAAATNARIYHLDGLRRDVVHMGLKTASRVAPGLLLRRFDWLYGHDVTREHP
jgi:salicylate hydroxylase